MPVLGELLHGPFRPLVFSRFDLGDSRLDSRDGASLSVFRTSHSSSIANGGHLCHWEIERQGQLNRNSTSARQRSRRVELQSSVWWITTIQWLARTLKIPSRQCWNKPNQTALECRHRRRHVVLLPLFARHAPWRPPNLAPTPSRGVRHATARQRAWCGFCPCRSPSRLV